MRSTGEELNRQAPLRLGLMLVFLGSALLLTQSVIGARRSSDHSDRISIVYAGVEAYSNGGSADLGADHNLGPTSGLSVDVDCPSTPGVYCIKFSGVQKSINGLSSRIVLTPTAPYPITYQFQYVTALSQIYLGNPNVLQVGTPVTVAVWSEPDVPDGFMGDALLLADGPVEASLLSPVPDPIYLPTPTPAPLTGVSISGPALRTVGELSEFTAFVEPVTTTTLVAYEWQAPSQDIRAGVGGISDTVSYSWTSPGPKLILVKADNVLVAPVSTTHVITIVDGVRVTVDPSLRSQLYITGSQGQVSTVIVPSGSVTQPIELVATLGASREVSPSRLAMLSLPMTVQAYRVGVPITEFAFQLPITLTMSYTHTDVLVIDENVLEIHYFDGAQWIDASETCRPTSQYVRDVVHNTLSVGVCHLTEFAVLGLTPAKVYLSYVARP